MQAMDPILMALNPGQIAEALRDYVTKLQKISPADAAAAIVKVSWNTSGDSPIAAVAMFPAAPPPKPEQRAG